MNEFKREHRYYVIKRTRLNSPQEAALLALLVEEGISPVGECVVVESDWPMYEPTWQAIQEYVEGARQPSQIEIDRDIKAANLQLLVDKVLAEDALYERLTADDCPMEAALKIGEAAAAASEATLELARSLKQ